MGMKKIDKFFDWIDNHFMESFIILLIAGCVVLLFGLMAAMYIEVTSEKIELRKDSWKCTATQTVSTSSMMLVGKVMIPTTSTTTVCTKWEHI